MQELLQRVAEANACLPYSGVAAAARPDEAVLVALLSLLPPPPPPDANPPPPQALWAPPSALWGVQGASDCTSMCGQHSASHSNVVAVLGALNANTLVVVGTLGSTAVPAPVPKQPYKWGAQCKQKSRACI